MTTHALRYGLYLPPFGPFGDPAVLVDLAVRAEASGWDGVFPWDHLVSGALPIADPWTTLGAIAQATRDLRFGPMVTPLPRRRPWVVARHASALSRLSGGRLILGTGLGADEFGDLSRFGEPTDLPTLSAMYDEGLEVVRGVWSGRPFHHDGQHYRVTLGEGVPDPHPIPVWVASTASHPRVIRRAAACDGIFPIRGNRTPAPDDVAGLLTALRRGRAPRGPGLRRRGRGQRQPGLGGAGHGGPRRARAGGRDVVDGVADPFRPAGAVPGDSRRRPAARVIRDRPPWQDDLARETLGVAARH